MECYLLAVSGLSITLREEICAKSNLFVQIEKYFKILQIWLIQSNMIKVKWENIGEMNTTMFHFNISIFTSFQRSPPPLSSTDQY